MRQNPENALGVFDSGLGGLTVARALRNAFPGEAIVYLGDTARVPYGTKSPETVKQYARENIAFLLGQGVKVIVAACNTVSAAALPEMSAAYPVPVLGVVEMGAEAALEWDPAKVGVIGTATTVDSLAYARALQRRKPSVEVLQKACPLFVPLIEEGWIDHPVTRQVVETYLAPMKEAGIDALILGCTHYPLIKPVLADYFGPDTRIVDSAEAMARALKAAVAAGELAPAEKMQAELSRYYVTDRCNHFQELVNAFMGDASIQVTQIGSDELTRALEGIL